MILRKDDKTGRYPHNDSHEWAVRAIVPVLVVIGHISDIDEYFYVMHAVLLILLMSAYG